MRRLRKLPFAVKFGFAISALAVGMTTVSVSFLYAQLHTLFLERAAERLRDVGQTGSFLLQDADAQVCIQRLTQYVNAEARLVTESALALPPGEVFPSLPAPTSQRLMASGDFQALVQILRQIGEASRSEFDASDRIYSQPSLDEVKNPITISAYLMVEIPEVPDHELVRFLADGLYEPLGDWPGNEIGNVYRIADPLFAAAFEGRSQTGSSFYSDDLGTWLTAAVPIKNEQGAVIAVLGLDLDANREAEGIRQLKLLCVGAVMVSLVLSSLVALGLGRWLGPPIMELQAGAERVRKFDYSALVSVKSPNELRQLAEAFNAMVKEIRVYARSLEAQNKALETQVAERTQTLTDTLKVLKATQAELLVENALLRDSELDIVDTYQVGGSLPLTARTYVVRHADRQLYRALRQGQFCYIFNARQMGKSSLRVRTMRRLESEGTVCAAIDLSAIGNRQTSQEQWYAGFMYTLASSLSLIEKADVLAWWKAHAFLPPLQRLGEFVEQVVLTHISERMVVFVDEVDSVMSLEFEADDFFIWLRNCYNRRAESGKAKRADYQRLTFVLLGVASPSQLMKDANRTPFNIGEAIALRGFQIHEAYPLLQGFSPKVAQPQSVLAEVLRWTGGQPFLSQKVCQLIREADELILIGQEEAYVDELVRSRIIRNWEAKDDPEHLRTVRDRILSPLTPTRPMLEIYQQLLQDKLVVSDDSRAQNELRLSGLVVSQAGELTIANPIYAAVFHQTWVAQSLSQLDPE